MKSNVKKSLIILIRIYQHKNKYVMLLFSLQVLNIPILLSVGNLKKIQDSLLLKDSFRHILGMDSLEMLILTLLTQFFTTMNYSHLLLSSMRVPKLSLSTLSNTTSIKEHSMYYTHLFILNKIYSKLSDSISWVDKTIAFQVNKLLESYPLQFLTEFILMTLII